MNFDQSDIAMNIDCQQALGMIKQGFVLTLAHSMVRTLFLSQKERIKVVTDQGTYRIKESDFLFLYHHELFFIFEFPYDDTEVMKQKDEEYYGWKHK